MTNKEFDISIKCLFCGSELKGDAEKEYKSGDMLKCQECSELNDYDSLIDVAIEEGKVAIKNDVSKMLKDMFKK
jgi:DNA-directed RNA polymerase subunit RPC12/RpoP